MTTIWILGLDASTPRCVLALGTMTDGRATFVAGDDELDEGRQASIRLTERLQALWIQAGISAADISMVACGRGPGTFTGTRVALATAKGLAIGLGCPLLPVSTLSALARSAASWADMETPAVLATLDARRGDVYGALFQSRHGAPPHADPIVAEQTTTMQDLVASVASTGVIPDAVVGPGAAAYPEDRPAHWPAVEAIPGPSPEGLWRAMVAAYHAGHATDPVAVDAVYLRQSYAELGLNPPKRPFVKSPFV